MHDSKWKTKLRRRLLKWFDQHQRDLPWRKNKTPYRVWVSEIMLQQTQVATVIDYYNRFMKRFPSVRKLAVSEESEVLKLWEGLGYYRRARQMHKAAKLIVDEHGGIFPTEFDAVHALPGIGRYTAGAILSISEDQRLPILEGNTIRLFARLLGMKSDPRSTKNQQELWAFSDSLLPRKRVGDFNQSLMELGSEICKPKSPACEFCPIMNLCPTFLNSWQAEIPNAGKKIAYESINEAAVLICIEDRYLLRKCGPKERWAGLWDFPRYKLETKNPCKELEQKIARQFDLRVEIRPTDWSLKHGVTKYRIQLDCFVGRLTKKSGTPTSRHQWQTLNQIDDLAMSVTGRKVAELIKRDQYQLLLPMEES